MLEPATRSTGLGLRVGSGNSGSARWPAGSTASSASAGRGGSKAPWCLGGSPSRRPDVSASDGVGCGPLRWFESPFDRLVGPGGSRMRFAAFGTGKRCRGAWPCTPVAPLGEPRGSAWWATRRSQRASARPSAHPPGCAAGGQRSFGSADRSSHCRYRLLASVPGLRWPSVPAPGRDYSVDPLSAPWEWSSRGGARSRAQRVRVGVEPGNTPEPSRSFWEEARQIPTVCAGRFEVEIPRSRRNGMGGAVNQ